MDGRREVVDVGVVSELEAAESERMGVVLDISFRCRSVVTGLSGKM